MNPNRLFPRRPRLRLALGVALTTAALSLTGCGEGEGTAIPPLPNSAPETVPLSTQLTSIENKYGVQLGVTALRPDSGQPFEYNAGDRFAMCSVFKVYAVAALLRLAEQGQLDMNEQVPVEPGHIVVNSPVTSTQVGRTMSYVELSRAALERSDNAAANLLLGRLGGPQAVTDFARSVGDTETRLDRWEPDLNEALPGDPRDTTTPTALATGYRAVILGSALRPESRDLLVSWMRASVTSGERMRKDLPQGWTAADKTGGGAYGSVNDAGVVWSPDQKPLVLVIFSRSATGSPTAAASNPAIAEAAAAVVNSLGA